MDGDCEEHPKPWCPKCGAALWENIVRSKSGDRHSWACSNAACGYTWHAPKDEAE